jgi:hypothetical protein
MDKKHDEDTRAILARREAFVKQALSKSEISSAKGGSLPAICLSILPTYPQMCLSPALTELKEPQPCLSPASPY